MSNLPDDWNTHYTTCAKCGGENHPSGTVECVCAHVPDTPCSCCEELFSDDDLVHIDELDEWWCDPCSNADNRDEFIEKKLKINEEIINKA
jgi:hypothetical protein|tara:strand:- start:239 stop:511 length:273 start_codon:yes stop_codon:yes gene_type:complete